MGGYSNLQEILKQLRQTDKEDQVVEERERRKNVRQTRVQADIEGGEQDSSRVRRDRSISIK